MCCPLVSISDCFSSSDEFRWLQRRRLRPAPRGGWHRCKTAAALSEMIDTFQRHVYWWACLCGCVRPSWADCVSRTKQWGCRRRNCSSYTERRYSCALCACVLLSLWICSNNFCVLCGSTLWRQRCCLPVRSWVNRVTPMQQPHRAWSNREMCCKMGCSAPAGSCPESALWACMLSHITTRHVGTFMLGKAATVLWNRTCYWIFIACLTVEHHLDSLWRIKISFYWRYCDTCW